MPISPEMISLSIGGNDIGFGPLIKGCLAGGRYACINLLQIASDNIDALYSSGWLETMYRMVKQRPSGDVPTFVMGYPNGISDDLLVDSGNMFSWFSRMRFTELGDHLNLAIKCAAEITGVHYVPVDFSGHEAYAYPGLDWINGLRPSALEESFHPNKRGQIAYAETLKAFLQGSIPENPRPKEEHEIDPKCSELSRKTVDSTIHEIGDLELEAANQRCNSNITFAPGEVVRISGAGFAPGSNVDLQFVADNGELVRQLTGATSSGAGILNALREIPNDAPPSGMAGFLAVGMTSDGNAQTLVGLISLAPSTTGDRDGDGVPDICDTCPATPGNQLDNDGDGVGNVCDPCPNDAENDWDQDGLCEDEDPCPVDPFNDADGDGACGSPEALLSSLGVHQYVIPASAHAAGLEDTRWLTDVTVFNTSDDDQAVTAFFLDVGEDNSGTKGKWVKIQGDEVLSLPDIVEVTFRQSSASGAIIIGSDEPLLVSSRTYNTAANGTFGQFVPGLSTAASLGEGEKARLIQLTRNTDFRTNIGFTNATGQVLIVNIDLRRANGNHIAQQSYTLQPYAFFQKTDIIGTNIDDAYAIVSSSTPGAMFFTYASVVDNNSGDPVLILPPAKAVATGNDVYIAAAAHVAGAAGTNWRTNLEVHNPGSARAQYTIALLKKNLTNTSPTTRSFSLEGGKSMRYEDVLLSVFGFDGAGALRVTPTSGSIMVTSRTFNDASSGTFGQFIAGVTTESAIAHGQEGRLIQLSRSSSASDGFRTNIGFVNATGSSIEVKVEMYAGEGTRLGEKTYTLKPFEYDQVSDIFGQVTNGEVENGFAVVSTTTSGARFFAYASVVDNRSGDPVYIPATVEGEALEPSPPTTAPSLTADSVSSSQINLSWTAVADVTGYKLYRGPNLIYSGPNRSFNHRGREANTQYCYTVRAYNSAGDGPMSAQRCATTQADGGADEITVSLPGGVPLVMLRVPAGTFMMGSSTDERGRDPDEDLHEVTLTRGYYLGKYEVTQEQWTAVMGSNPAHDHGVGDDYPVYFVSWNDVCGGSTGSDCASTSFIGRLNQILGTDVFRLPTEAEWERAARADTQTSFSHGEAEECANSCGFCELHDRHMVWCGNGNERAERVGTRLPNGFGLFDMHGNIFEFVADWYMDQLGTDPQTDPTGPSSGSILVGRGGFWDSDAADCRSANRWGVHPSGFGRNFGFRLARTETGDSQPPVSAPGLTATAISASQINLSWTQVSGANGYRLFRGSTLVHSGTSRTWSDSDLTAGTEYCYQVLAYNSAGDGPRSASVCATTDPGGIQDEITIDLGGGVTMDLIHIPAGTFMMGSPNDERGRDDNEDLHSVNLTYGFYVAETETTYSQWSALMGSDPVVRTCSESNCPVANIDRPSADAFIQALRDYVLMSDLQIPGVVRLPSDAEWEKAAREGTTSRFSYGDALECNDDQCHFCDLHDRYMHWCGNTGSPAQPVKQKLPNPVGLFDMHGNIQELVLDGHVGHLGTDPVTNPLVRIGGANYVTRGGSYDHSAEECRSARRGTVGLGIRHWSVGFRVALSGPGGPNPVNGAFSWFPAAPAANQLVQFSDDSTGFPSAFVWWWDFDDGTYSREQNPTHKFTAPGTYRVSMHARNGLGSPVVVHDIVVQ